MLKQKAKAKSRFNSKLFRFSCKPTGPARRGDTPSRWRDGDPGRPDDKLREFRRRTLSGASVPLRSLHPKQFDVEDQRGIRWNDAAGTACAIAEFGRNNQRALTADFHGGDA